MTFFSVIKIDNVGKKPDAGSFNYYQPINMHTKISSSIIMRIKEFGESDLLINFFTIDHGFLKGVAKGALKSRKRFANCLDLFCMSNIEYDIKDKNGLHFLHSGKLLQAFPGVRNNFTSLSLASYMVELTESLFPQGICEKEMFELLKKALLILDKGAASLKPLRVFFEARAMALGGYEINFDRCCDCKRPYTGQGTAVFNKNKGGIACLRCQKESEYFPSLDPEMVRDLISLQAGIPSPAWLAKSEKINGHGKVLKLHLNFHLGKNLATAKYLADY